MMKFVDPIEDVAFQKIFESEKHKDILMSFLNATLDLKGKRSIKDVSIIYDVSILSSIYKIEDLKGTLLDIEAVDKRGETCIIVIQIERKEPFGREALYYSNRAYKNRTKHSKLNGIYFIGILDFSIFKGESYITRHLILNDQKLKKERMNVEFNFVELSKFNKSEEKLESVIEKWIYFLKHAKNLSKIPESLVLVEEIREAFKILDQHSWSQKELDAYEYWSMKAIGHKDALQCAWEDAREKELKKGRSGMPPSEIAKLTNLSVEDIEQ